MTTTMQGQGQWRRGDGFGTGPCVTFEEEEEEECRYLHAQIGRHEDSIAASTRRSLAVVCESEQIGVDTAEELLRQGEQLTNIQRDMKTINRDLKETRRSINSIKSVFGAIRNKFTKRDDSRGPLPEQRRRDDLEPSSSLRAAVHRAKLAPEHPVQTQRTKDIDSIYGRGSRATSGKQGRSADDEADQNLELLSEGLERLKGLGLGLQQTMAQQDEIIGDINKDLPRALDQMKTQTYDMKHHCH